MLDFLTEERMIRSKGKDDGRVRVQSLPLIMPMPRSSHRVVDSNSPWLSMDPMLWNECLNLYRSVRLILLALIAFATGPRRIRAEAAGGESLWQTSAAVPQMVESPELAPQHQPKILHYSLQARADFRALPASNSLLANARVIGATELAVDAPRRETFHFVGIRAHAPPASSTLTSLLDTVLTSSKPLLKSVRQHQPPFFGAYRQALEQISALPVLDPPSMQGSVTSAATLALQVPKRQAPQLEVIRAHAPPSSRLQIGFDSIWFDSSLKASYSVDTPTGSILQPRKAETYSSRAAPAKSAQIAIINLDGKHVSQSLFRSKFQYIHRHHPHLLRSIDCNSRKSCHYKSAEKARLRQRCLLVIIQSTPLKGDYFYVRC
jgi:hypothetical protein